MLQLFAGSFSLYHTMPYVFKLILLCLPLLFWLHPYSSCDDTVSVVIKPTQQWQQDAAYHLQYVNVISVDDVDSFYETVKLNDTVDLVVGQMVTIKYTTLDTGMAEKTFRVTPRLKEIIIQNDTPGYKEPEYVKKIFKHQKSVFELMKDSDTLKIVGHSSGCFHYGPIEPMFFIQQAGKINYVKNNGGLFELTKGETNTLKKFENWGKKLNKDGNQIIEKIEKGDTIYTFIGLCTTHTDYYFVINADTITSFTDATCDGKIRRLTDSLLSK